MERGFVRRCKESDAENQDRNRYDFFHSFESISKTTPDRVAPSVGLTRKTCIH
jgi:hypothetical protein